MAGTDALAALLEERAAMSGTLVLSDYTRTGDSRRSRNAADSTRRAV